MRSKARLVGQLVGGADEDLADQRRGGAGGHADERLVDRDVAPAEHSLALGGDRLLDERGDPLVRLLLLRQEQDADREAAALRQRERDDGAEELVGQLQQDARAVAGRRVCARGTTVLEVLERVERATDHAVVGFTRDLGYERDTTGVVLM